MKPNGYELRAALFVVGMVVMATAAWGENFVPRQDRLPVEAPAGAVVLLGAGVAPRFVGMDGGPTDWKHDGDVLVVTTTE